MPRDVFVTGLGLVTPLEAGRGVESFWNLLKNGTCRIRPAAFLDKTRYRANLASEIVEIERIESENRWLKLSNIALGQALQDACLIDGEESYGLVIGTVLGGILEGEKHWRGSTPKERYTLPEEYSLSYGLKKLVEKCSIKGPSLMVSTACSSGTDALGIACRKILSGQADIMIAGGCDCLSEFAFSGFNALKALSGTCVRPFDKNRDGLALGEGAGFLVLESGESVLKRNSKIYGKIQGYASRSDAHHMTGPDREGRGLSSAIEEAMREAHLNTDGIDYINAHGTGTDYNDLMETKAIKKVFKQRAYELLISSIKSMMGHSFGAAGAIEAITCLLAIQNNGAPPTINYRDKDPECDLNYVPNEAINSPIQTAMSLSAGFGGQNAVVIFSGEGV